MLRRIALRRKGKCRLRDPPQAVHPAEQDAFLYEREISFRFYKNTIMRGAQGLIPDGLEIRENRREALRRG